MLKMSLPILKLCAKQLLKTFVSTANDEVAEV